MKSSKSLHSLAFVVLCFAASLTRADVTLTPATGGTTISADSTAGTFTALTGPVLSEGATGDISTGTIVLNSAAGFEFDTNSAVTVAVTGSGSGNDIALLSNTADVTPSNITIQVTAPSDGTETSVLTWSGINVRPTAGTPLASGTISESGTATFTLVSTPTDNYGALAEVAGTVSALAFTVQPGSATAGAAFGTQPTVVTVDQFGNASTSGLGANLNVNVSLTAGTGPLQGTTTLDIGTSAGNGSVSFTNLQIDISGTDKQLTPSASGLTDASSSVFAVTHAAAATLAIQQQPSSAATAGVAFAQQPIVAIQDAFGNLVDDDNGTVITAARNGGSGVLQGTLTATASGGVATFSDLAHNVANNITISFTSGSLTSATSGTIAISPSAADHLVFTIQPDSATAGSAFGTQPSLVTQDSFGNASTVGLPANLNVVMSLSGTGTLQGTATQDIGTAVGNGSVSFTDLRIDTSGSKQLTASASGLTSATSSAFSVSHATASALTIQQQPSSTANAGVAFAQQPIVRIEDSFGNLINDDNSTVVTAARNAGTGTLQGTVSATVSGGVATFTDLAHNVADNITITFSSGSLASATSSTVAVSPAAADRLVFTAQPGSATAGAAFGTQPALISKDQFGNASTVGLPANLNVSVTLSSGTGTLQGTLTQDIGTAAGNGSVAFTDLRIDTAGSKQIAASASGLISATSSSFTVSHAAASALTIQQQPSSTATAGVAFAQQPIVRIEDAFGNLIDDDNSTVVTAARNAGAGTLQGTVSATVSGGGATFTDLAHNVSGNITITFTSGSLTSATSGAVAVNAAVADHLVFTSQPGSATAGAAFGNQPALISEDQFGNASAVGLPANLIVNVTLSSGTGTLQGTTTQDIGTAAGNGSVTFTDLRMDTAGSKQLTASASGLTSGTSSAFTVSHSTASALTIQQQPSSTATAGVDFAQQPIARIEDAFGNLIDDDNGSVVTATRNGGSGTLQGTTNITVVGGVATFTNLSHNVAGNITIDFSSGSLSSATSTTVTVSPAAADHLVFTTQPTSATAGSAFGTQPALISEDQFGNTSTVGLPANLDVTITLSAGTGPLQGTTTQDIGTAAGNGSVTFTDLRIDVSGSDKQLTATASGLTGGSSSLFTVNHAAASALVIQQQPSSSATAGVAFAQQPVVQIQDSYGNLVDDDNSTVITATRNVGTGALQGTVTATGSSGVATFTDLSHNVAGNITISFSSGSLSPATSTSITISPAAANHLVFVSQPGSATAGSAFGAQPSLISEDQFGNASAVGLPANLNVTMTLSSGTGTLQGTTSQDIGTAAGNGTGTFTDLRIDTAGSKQLTASASGLTSASSSAFTVNHAAASTLTIQQQPSTTVTAGVEFAQQPIVRIEDSFGNLITDDNSSVITAARSAGLGTLQGTLSQPVSGGVATFTNLSHNVAGNITIAFASGSLAATTSTSIAIDPAAADHLVFTTQPGAATAGSAFGTQPTLISEDQFGNASAVGLPANLDVTATLSAGTGPLQGTTTQDIGTAAGNGSVTFTDLRIDVAGIDKQLTASASGLTSASSSVFTVNHAAASALVIQQQPSSSATAGVAFAQQPIVRIEDAFGNLISDDNSTVISAARNAGIGTLQGTLTATASGGVASFANLAHNVAGNITINFSSGSLSSATSGTVAVSPAAADHLVFTAQPGSATAGTAFGSQPALISQDQFGNASAVGLPANLNVSVTLSSGTGTLQGTSTQDIGTAAGNGSVAFTNLRIDTAGSKQLAASASGLASATSSAFTVNHATASALTIQQQPSATATAGVDFAQQPIVRIEDAFGNLINDDNSSVVTATRNAGSGTLQGTTNITVVGGVAAFTNLSHIVAGNITIDFSSGSLSSATSTTVAVSPAAADHLVFTTQPGSATAGSAFGSQPALISQDQFGNASAVGLPANLNVNVSLSSGTGALQGTTTQDIGTAAGNGTVTFTNLRIDTAGSKQLTASASGLTSATSSAFTVSHAAASVLTLQQQPSASATAGVAFAQQPIVRIEDAFGNLVNDDNSTVVTAARNAGSGTLQGNVSLTAVAGIVGYFDLSHNIAGAVTILFTSGSLGAVQSSSITINPAPADHLVFITQPGSATAGAVFGSQPSIKSKDAFGNDSSVGLPANLNVTLTLAAGTGPLQGTTTQDIGTAAGNGLVSFTNLRIDSAGNNKQLSAAASGLTSSLSSVFVVNHDIAAKLGIQTQPSLSAIAGQLFAQQPVIQIEDQFGNLISEDNATAVTAARNGGSGTLQGTVTLIASSGVVTYTNLSHTVANDITISFSASGLTATNSGTVAITPAAADHLVFTSQPASATAGTVFTSTVVAKDQFDNSSHVGLPLSLNLTVSLSSGSGTLQGSITKDIGTAAGNGSASFSDLRIDTAGVKQLTASASGLTSATGNTFTVVHASPSKLTIQQQPSSTATAGVAFAQQPIVRIEDTFGNLITEDNSTVITAARNAGSGTLQGTLTTTASGGVATFANLSHNVASSITITFTGGSLASATSSTVNVSPGSSSKLVILTQPGATATAGQAFSPQPSVAIEDQFNNIVTSDNTSLIVVARTFGGALQGTLSATAANGIATFVNLSETEATTLTLDFTSGSLIGARSSSITVNPAAADHLAISRQPSSTATAGTVFATQPIVQIQDQYNNVLTSDNTTVVTAVRSSGSGTLQGTTTATASSGVATFANLFHTLAGNITILFSSGSLTTDVSSSILVNAANATHLVFTTQPAASTAGAVFGVQPVIASYDAYGNASAAGLASSVPVSITLQSGTGPLQGTTTMNIGTAGGNGAVSFTDLRIDSSGSGKQLQASASGLTSATSSAFTVAHATAAQLVIQTQPSTNATAGDILTNQPVIQIADNYGNTITEDNSTAVTGSLHGGGTGLEGTLTLTAASGLVTFTNLSFDFAATVQLDFNGGSFPAVTSDVIHVAPAAGSRLLIDTQPGSTATAGQLFSPQPVVSLRDGFGNISSSDNVTQVTVTRSQGGTLLGTTTLTAVNGIFTFTDLAETVSGTTTLTFSGTGLSSVVSSSITVSPGPLAQLSVHTQPSSTITAGQQFPQQPVVWLTDAYGNLCSTDNSTVVTASRSSGVGNLQGTTNMTAVNGIVTYTNLTHFNATTINLTFTAGSFSATSSPVTVTAGPATALAFSQLPAGQAGHVLTTPPIVKVTDAFGNVPTSVPGSVPVTISISSGTGNLFGTTTVDAGASFGAGFATFTGLQINALGTKQLTASAPGLTSGVSGNFTITGTAQPLESFGSTSIGHTITSLWVGNFRGASTARDAVAVNHDDMMLTLRMSKDDGTFDTAATISLPAHPIAARAADLNGDGYDDLVVTYDDTNIVSVLLSTGSHGTNFAAPVPYVFSALSNPQATSMFLADLNNDGKTDLIVATAADNNINVLFGTSGAAFTSPITYPVGANPVWINVSDVNHDGIQDIVTANKDDGTISILHGDSGGNFVNSQTVTLGGNPQPVRVTTPDINRDGRLDLAVVNYASNTVSILVQQSNGSFLLSSNYTVGIHPTDFFLRDIDGDGFSDLAVLNSGSGTIDILFNRGTSNYVSQSTVAAGVAPTALFGGKFVSSVNLNGLLVADSADNSMAVYMFAGPTAVSSSVNVSENASGLIILGAHNPLFPKIYNFTITQYPTNGTITGTAPTLTYTPNHEYIGADTLKFRAYADGVTSAVAVVSISVLAVNHAPSFTMATNTIYLLQGKAYTQKTFITSKNPGAVNESAQKIDYVLSNIDTSLYATVPAIATTGTLTFKLAPLARGTNDVVIYAHDSGGVARGGTNVSPTQVLRIIALRYDHAPVVKAIPMVTMLEDAPGTNITITVTDLDDGITNISVTPVSLSESIIPTANISVSAPTTETNFVVSFAPAPDANGLATIQLQVFDGQDTTLATFKVNVLAVDDQPSFALPNDDVFALQDSGTITVSNFCTSVYAGAANESSQVLSFVIGNQNPKAFAVQPSIDKYGTLKFRPAIGYLGTNTFSVYLKDSATTIYGGVNTSDTNSFTISITTNNFRHITGTYNGLFYENSGVAHASSGFFTFLLSYTRTFTGRVQIEGGTFPLTGKFDTNGFAQISVARRTGPSLGIQLEVDLTGGSDQVTGTVASDDFSSDLLGDRQPTTLPASILPGRYNVAFVSDGTGTNDLGGDAVGTVTVASNNRLTFSGTLPDRTVISQSIAVSKDGQWPLYIPCYAGAGSMIGWLTVANDNQPIQANVINISKESNLRNPFPVGFTNEFSVMSSTNVTFAHHVPVISTNGIVTFSNADLVGDLAVPYSMTDDNFMFVDTSGHNVRLGFDHTFGYMSGTFIDPTTGLTARVRALLLPNVNQVRGYFYTAKPDPAIGTPDTGEFFLQGN